MRVAFHPAAAAEFKAAVEYYEEALPSLGRRFRDEIRDTIDLALAHPDAGSRRRAGSRHLIVSGFPYDLVYQVRGDGPPAPPSGVLAGAAQWLSACACTA